MDIKISKSDVVWGYLSVFFQLFSGFIILPLILRLLSPEEVGFNYLMMTIASMVVLFDFGFSPQFGRNLAYVFGGAQELKKEGMSVESSNTINYKLLATLISVAKMVYQRLSVFIFVLMLTLGSVYTNYVTYGFTTVRNAFPIWIVFSISTFLNFYFSYYNSLLIGRGQIKESKIAVIASRVVYIVLACVFLLLDYGLMGVCLANLLAPFVSRYMGYRYFYDQELRTRLGQYKITQNEKIETFKILWYNTKKIGINLFGTYCVNKFGMFLAGLFLSLQEVASYGLMLQLGGIVITLSISLFTFNNPRLAALRVQNDRDRLLREFSMQMVFFHLTAIIGTIVFVGIGPQLLDLIHSRTVLPPMSICTIYMIVMILENYHSSCAVMITVGNKVPFVPAALTAGFAIVILSFLSLKYTSLGILGLVLVQGICQLVYNNWKWPIEAYKELGSNPFQGEIIGIKEMRIKCCKYMHCVK